MKSHLWSTAALAAIALPTAAFAQQVAPGEQSAGHGLEEIVVTAQKRAENLQSVPIAVTAATGDQLAARGIVNTMQLNTLAPGLNLRQTNGSFQPAIRGIGTSSTVSESPVALYIDGVYIPQQREGARELEDIDQITVLKGPQGTLFGRNATAGVLQITTKAPSFTFGGTAHADIDNYATGKAGLYLTGPLSDNVAVSLSGTGITQGKGWGKDLTNGHDTFKIQHEVDLRGKILVRFDPDTEMTLAGDYSNSKALFNSQQPLAGTQLSFPNPYTAAPLTSVYDTYAGQDSFVAMKGGGVSATLSHSWDWAKLVSITAYRDVISDYQFDQTAVPQPYQVVHSPHSPSRSFSEELQLVSKSRGKLDWMFGVFYFNYDNGAFPIQRNFAGPIVSPATNIVQTMTYAMERAKSVAPFGQAKLEILAGLHLTVGARYTYEERTLHSSRVESTTAAGVTTTAYYGGSSTYKNPTFRAAIDYQVTPTVLAYGSFNTGFKSGGYNTVSPATAAYAPEKLKAYEAGIKMELADRRIRLNLAGFYYDYTNLQVAQFINGVQSVVNGPSARLYGLDADFAVRLSSELRASGGFEVMHATFTNYPGAVFAAPKVGGGATIFAGDATGNRIPLAQNFTGNVALDYHHDLSRGSIDYNLTGNYNGDYYIFVDNFIRQPAYVIINTSLSYNLPGGHVTLSIWGKNLADRNVITNSAEQGIGFVTSYATAPRTFGATARYKF